MKTLKVWGGRYYGLEFNSARGNRMIVAAYTKKQAMDLTGISQYEMKNYWSETGNTLELETATEVGVWVFDGHNKLLGRLK